MRAVFRPQFWLDLEDGVAYLTANAYLLFYRWTGDALEILRIKHGMMDLPSLFAQEHPTLEN